MKTADQWFDEYALCHQNRLNKAIHWVCIPAIVWSTLALLWSLPVPLASDKSTYVNWATLSATFSLIFYFRLSRAIGIAMLIFFLVCMGAIKVVAQSSGLPLWQVALITFALAWVGQFIGHYIEGKKPSFFKDLQFLLIGPAWLIQAAIKRQ